MYINWRKQFIYPLLWALLAAFILALLHKIDSTIFNDFFVGWICASVFCISKDYYAQ